MKKLATLVLPLCLAACGGPGSFNGTVAGIKLDVKSSVFLQGTDSNGVPNSAWVALTDVPAACDEVKSNRTPKNGTIVVFLLERYDANNKRIAPDKGDYTVTDNIFSSSGNIAFANFSKQDTNCTNTIQAKNSTGRSGLIKVDGYKGVTGGNISGSFDVTFGDQNDRVTGGFNADFCDAAIPLTPNCE